MTMELPAYIQEKIKKQNHLITDAWCIAREIDEWCAKKGIDIESEEYKECRSNVKSAVSPINIQEIKRMYNAAQKTNVKKGEHRGK